MKKKEEEKNKSKAEGEQRQLVLLRESAVLSDSIESVKWTCKIVLIT